LEEYQNLRPFPDVLPGLERLRSEGHTLVAFSNGVERTARVLLERGGVLDHLEDVVSVDDLGTFKPDPEVYRYLARRLDRGEVRGVAGGLGEAEPRHRLRSLGDRGRPRGGGPGATRREALNGLACPRPPEGGNTGTTMSDLPAWRARTAVPVGDCILGSL
jgi:hypothetical protein